MKLKSIILAAISVALFSPVASRAETTLSVDLGQDEALTIDVGWPDATLNGVRWLELGSGKDCRLLFESDSGGGQQVRIQLDGGRLRLLIGTPEDPPPPPGPVLPDDDDDDEDPPEPDDPTPDPEVPEGHLGFTRDAFNWAVDLVELSKDPERSVHARKQAVSYATVAAGLAAPVPKYTSIATAFKELRKLNQEVLPAGPIRDAWAAWGGRISTRIDELWPFSKAEGSAILGAISAGLEVVP